MSGPRFSQSLEKQMRSKWKCPGDALQRIPGTEIKSSNDATFAYGIYPTFSDLQTRRLRQRFGLDEHRARLLAALCYGEGR